MEIKGTTIPRSQASEEKRKAGKASTLKSFKTLVINIKENGLMNKEDNEKLKELYTKAFKQYLGDELF